VFTSSSSDFALGQILEAQVFTRPFAETPTKTSRKNSKSLSPKNTFNVFKLQTLCVCLFIRRPTTFFLILLAKHVILISSFLSIDVIFLYLFIYIYIINQFFLSPIPLHKRNDMLIVVMRVNVGYKR